LATLEDFHEEYDEQADPEEEAEEEDCIQHEYEDAESGDQHEANLYHVWPAQP
jgi:hypothetical protein